jgi:flagella basal body P-ring formation protein FlgA
VVVGDRVAILPADAIPEDQRWFYTAFLTFLEAQDAHKQGRIELELLDLPLLLESLGTAVSPERGMASGWEERIVFEADRSPYSSGFRSSPSYESIPAGTMRVAYRVLAPAASDSAGRLAADGYAAGALNTGPQMLEGSFRIWIHHFLPVARAAIDLPAGYGLSEDAVTFSEEDVSLLQSSFVVQGEELQRYKTLSSLRRGDLIDGRLLQRVLTVRAGDRVMITVARPGLRVTLPGRALRSGSIGDVVDVRPEATSKRFQARITSKGEVLVETD